MRPVVPACRCGALPLMRTPSCRQTPPLLRTMHENNRRTRQARPTTKGHFLDQQRAIPGRCREASLVCSRYGSCAQHVLGKRSWKRDLVSAQLEVAHMLKQGLVHAAPVTDSL